MATYPAGIYSYTNRTGTQTLLAGTHSTAHNEAAAEVIAIETELGTNPSGIYVNVGARLDALTALIGTQHTQNTDSGTTNATFYMNGASGALIKETGGAYAVRNNTDTAYVDFTCDDLTCSTINGITSVQLSSMQTDSHSHTNKALLDTYTQTEVDLADAVTKKHTQNTDTGTSSETFQMNNTNPGNSAKIKVDDLTPTFVDIRNAGDSAFAPIRASQFRGDLGANNADLNLPLIRYNDGVTDVWEFSNDGVNFYPLQAPALTLAGNPGTIQWNNTTNLGADNTFYYNDTTDTLYVSNINVSGLILGVTAVTGTVSDTWTINTDGNGLTIDTTGLSGDISITATELDDAVTNTHAIATVLDSASIDFTLVGQQITAAVLPAGVDHNSLNNYSANRHIDHTAVSISTGTGLTGGGDISATRTISLSHLGIQSLVDPNADRILFWDDSSTATEWLTVSTGLSLTGTNLTTNDSQIVHDSLSGYSANRHIDHTAVSISAGTGLTGGGDISANRTLSLSHLGIENLTDPNADRVMFWDDSAGIVTWLTVGSGLTITDTTITVNAIDIITEGNSSVEVVDTGTGYVTVTVDGSEKARFTPTAVGVATASPTATSGGVDIASGGISLVLGADNSASTRTNSTTKNSVISQYHYTNAEQSAVIIRTQSDATNNYVQIGGGDSALNAATNLIFYTSGDNTTLEGTQRLIIDPSGNIVPGTAALATNATNGFLYIESCAGIPTGVPAGSYTGRVPIIWDSTNDDLYVYDGGWQQTGGGGATLTRGTFTNATLSSGILTITHSAGLSAPYTVMVTIFDNNYQQIIPDSITGATNSVAVDLSSYVTAGGGSISGTWGYGYIA